MAYARKIPFEVARQYLMDYLRDEFAKFPEVRFRFMLDSHEVGIMARTESREYFFPTSWAEQMQQSEITALVRRMKEALPDRGEP